MTKKERADYEVGYGKPPKAHQFGPGQSGNPKGRPSASRNAGKLLCDRLFERVTITQNGRRIRIPYLEVIILRLRQKAVEGDARAMDQLIRLLPVMEHHQEIREDGERKDASRQEEDLRILDDFLATYGPEEKTP